MERSSYTEIIAFFGNKSALAAAITARCPWWPLSRQAVTGWKGVIPQGRAYQIEVITRGRFKAANIIRDCHDMPRAA